MITDLLVYGIKVYCIMSWQSCFHSTSASCLGSMDRTLSDSSFLIMSTMVSTCASMIVGPFDSAVGA